VHAVEVLDGTDGGKLSQNMKQEVEKVKKNKKW
jgi:hypothetical protein